MYVRKNESLIENLVLSGQKEGEKNAGTQTMLIEATVEPVVFNPVTFAAVEMITFSNVTNQTVLSMIFISEISTLLIQQ